MAHDDGGSKVGVMRPIEIPAQNETPPEIPSPCAVAAQERAARGSNVASSVNVALARTPPV